MPGIRPKGLKYNIKVKNKSWFKKGTIPWNKDLKGIHLSAKSEIKKGQRISHETEFKYTNGLGYRHLLFKKILPQQCSKCEEKNIKRLHIHHKDKNRSNNKLNNLLVLCRPHHLSKHNKIERNYVEGRKIVYV